MRCVINGEQGATNFLEPSLLGWSLLLIFEWIVSQIGLAFLQAVLVAFRVTFLFLWYSCLPTRRFASAFPSSASHPIDIRTSQPMRFLPGCLPETGVTSLCTFFEISGADSKERQRSQRLETLKHWYSPIPGVSEGESFKTTLTFQLKTAHWWRQKKKKQGWRWGGPNGTIKTPDILSFFFLNFNQDKLFCPVALMVQLTD